MRRFPFSSVALSIVAVLSAYWTYALLVVPLIVFGSFQHLNIIGDAVASGAELMMGGERMGNQGYFYTPTVLKNVPEEAKIMNEEPFGPVAPIASFESFDEVVARANKLMFGLASYAFTNDGARAAALGEQIEAGMLAVNSFVVSTPETPFGGIDESGYGSEGGIEGLDAYLRTKFITEVGV